jgi:hypothetical protein
MIFVFVRRVCDRSKQKVWLMNEQYNEVGKKFPQFSIERHMVMFESKRSKQKITCSTNIFIPLYQLSALHKTMPLWFNESVWKLFLGSDCEFDKRDLSELIHEHLNDSEKKLYNAISKIILINPEKKKTDGKLNFEMATTKAVMTKSQKKEKNLIKGKHCLKKENKGGEKTNSSEDKFVFVKDKAVRKPTTVTMILKKKNRLMEMRMSTLKKL